MVTETLAADVGHLSSRLYAAIRQQLAAEGVSLATARTLSTLDREGPQRLTDLASVEQVSQPSMSVLVLRLETAGLVERMPDAGDRRVAIVAITDRGREVLGAVIERRTRLVASKLDGLTASERAELERALPALRKLVDLVQERVAVAR